MESPQLPAEDLIGLKEAAELAGITHNTIRRWYETGRLHGIQIGRIHYTTKREVARALAAMDDSYAKRLRVGTPSPELMELLPAG